VKNVNYIRRRGRKIMIDYREKAKANLSDWFAEELDDRLCKILWDDKIMQNPNWSNVLSYPRKCDHGNT
jgi:hypothetical protein